MKDLWLMCGMRWIFFSDWNSLFVSIADGIGSDLSSIEVLKEPYFSSKFLRLVGILSAARSALPTFAIFLFCFLKSYFLFGCGRNAESNLLYYERDAIYTPQTLQRTKNGKLKIKGEYLSLLMKCENKREKMKEIDCLSGFHFFGNFSLFIYSSGSKVLVGSL